MICRQDIVDEARSWMTINDGKGTKWQHQQRLKGIATDCIGLIGGVALELGIEGAQEWADDQTLHVYGRTPDAKVLIGGCDRFLDRIPIADAAPGDVLVMAFSREPQHFAIISEADPMYLIHAYAQARRVVENGAKIAGASVLRAYSYRGVA